MRVPQCLGLLALACLSTGSLHPRYHETHDYYALHLKPNTSPQELASVLGLRYEGKLGELPDHHTFSSPRAQGHGAEDKIEDLRPRRRKREISEASILDGILWSQKQKTKPRMVKRSILPPPPIRQCTPPDDQAAPAPVPVVAVPVADADAVAERANVARELSIEDPIFNEQWHLFNTMQLGHDINVTGVWQQGITGEGATAVMVDDGIDMYSEDLKDNYFAKGSYDFNDDNPEPKPRLADDRHGTRCAGEIAAVKNGVCGVGVAYNARIGGLRILSKIITDEDEAHAMN